MTSVFKLSYRPDIQGLRAVAILLVVLAHVGIPAFSGGFVGVDVFFVLSGYLISGLLIQEYEANGNIRLVAFIGRRLKRLLPALLAMLCIVIFATSALLSAYQVEQQSASIVYAATWTSNIYFAVTTFDYFSTPQSQDLFLHTWSLGVEEQFYIFWPLLLLVSLAVMQKMGTHGRHRSLLITLLCVLFAGSLSLTLFWTKTHPLWSFYLMPSRIWQFALGALVYVWFNYRLRSPTNRSTPGSPGFRVNWTVITGLMLIIGSAIALHPNMPYPGYWALFPSLGAALAIAGGHRTPAPATNNVLAHPTLVWIGDRSYSLYLWHWPLLILGSSQGIEMGFAGTTSLIVIAMIMAMISYRWIEQPFWRGRLSHAAPNQSILVSILAMLMVTSGALNFRDVIHVDTLRVSDTTVARTDLPIVYEQGCDASIANSVVQPCVTGDTGAPHTAVLLGDSIGVQWYSLLPDIFDSPEWRVITLTKSACAMVDEDYFYAPVGQTYTICTDWRNNVLDYLSSIQPDVVFMGSSSTYGFSEAQWVNGSVRILSKLTAAADEVIVIPGTPSLSFDGPACLARHSNPDSIATDDSAFCQETLQDLQVTEVTGYLGQAVSQFQNASLLDLNDLVCPGGLCVAKNADGIIIFRDRHHLTDTFVRTQVPEMLVRLEPFGLLPVPTQ